MAGGGGVLFSIFLIFTGAAVLAGLALYARQSLLVAYIILGGLLGPWGLGWVADSGMIQQVGHVGIIFLLFLLGLNLHPQKLLQLLRQATVVTALSSALFALAGGAVALAFGFGVRESALIGAATMFSSTIIGLKLMPTTALHHRHTGEVVISVLLLQDIIAIAILLVLRGLSAKGDGWSEIATVLLALPLLLAVAFLFARYILVRLFLRFDTIQEYLFLAALGWCLGMAQLAESAGLTYEIGAFIAGVALASNPISRFIAESLKPLRDFFLIMFFFALGAGFELPMLPAIALPALLLALAMLVAKPLVFAWLLGRTGESPRLSREIGVRLGQMSEFALLIAVLATESGAMGSRASYLIQAATLITFIVSSYVVMLRFPTPIAVSARLRRD